MMQSAFKIDARDNVATALETLKPGPVRILGEAADPGTMCTEEIPRGHKISLKAIGPEEEVIKYGVCIGRAGADIGQGKWVHLHNMHSVYDERSSHLSAPTVPQGSATKFL